MEHTISLHDSNPEPPPEPFEVPSSYDAYQEPTPLHPFVAAEAVEVGDGWVQEEVPDEFEPEAVAEVEVEHHERFEPVEHHEHHEHFEHQPHEIHAVHEVPAFDEAPSFGEPAGPSDERRVVLQLTGGETVELRRVADADEAVEFAREAVRRIAAAEATGEWPEIDGRFLRPDSIFSVDVQVSG
jgi:hypothetical protein